MTAENDYDERATEWFLGKLAENEAPGPEAAIAPAAAADDAWDALLPLLTDEEAARAAGDPDYAAELERTYHAWAAKRPTPTPARAVAPAPMATEAADALSPGVLAFRDGRADFRDLTRPDQEIVVERHVGPPSSAAIAAYESGSREVALSANEQIEAVDRAFRRRGAQDRAERGLRW